MRRRNLLGGSSIDYVFSTKTTSISVRYESLYIIVDIISTANGSNIGYSVVSYDGTVVTSVTTAATSFVIYWSENSDSNPRDGYVVLKQNDSNKTITITLTQEAHPFELGYDAILLDGTSGSYDSIYVDRYVRFGNIPDWASVTYDGANINVTALSDNSDSTARFDTITIIVGNTSTELTIIQLPNDYHSRDYVTIGNLNWAIKNVGASSVDDYGNYYMYGKGAQEYNASDSAYEGTEDPLDSSVDTATQVMGSGWRMPTRSECQSLTASTYYWVSYNGVNGGVFESDGNVLFFPAAGYYNDGSLDYEGSSGCIWSSTPYTYNSRYACNLYFDSGDEDVGTIISRYFGFSVRGVQS